MAKGTKTVSVITSCSILSCAIDITVYPIRLAGTCNKYSNSAIPQLINAAITQGLWFNVFKWAYQAKVINTLLHINKPTEIKTGDPNTDILKLNECG